MSSGLPKRRISRVISFLSKTTSADFKHAGEFAVFFKQPSDRTHGDNREAVA